MPSGFAELHCHSNFSFLDGASTVEDLAEQAVQLGLTALALTDHNGLYGAVRFATAAQEVGLRPIVGMEVELLDTVVPDPAGLIVPRRRRKRVGRAPEGQSELDAGLMDGPPTDGRAVKPPWIACVRHRIGIRGARTCAASGRASWVRTSS